MNTHRSIPVFVILSLVLIACASNPVQTGQGRKLAFDRNKGNCLACHVIADGESPGNIGPPLQALSKRFRDQQQLRDFIYDARQNNPETSMPPFGANNILTDAELQQVVDYLWDLP